ncbi:hypothetical protein GCM10009737_15730 [Nocardioides lentus]|uniref:LppX_LprAFG lipoprotein n=1 Tax=Nocardioides lentus TaxID=338077 RepID=A0ABN2P977_9ACTN
MHRPPPALRGSRRLAALGLLAPLVLAGCGGEEAAPAGDPAAPAAPAAGASSSPGADDDREPAEILDAAVDATMEASRLRIASRAVLQVGGQGFSLSTTGSVDRDSGVADLRLGAGADGERSQVTVLSDGTDAWAAVEGAPGVTLPEGADWVRGPASALLDAPGFRSESLLGALLALRAAEDVEEYDAESHDGVTTRVFSTTVGYDEATSAAGADAVAFTTALALTGPAAQSDLEIEVAVGPDDVVRTYDLSIESDADVSGGYDVDLTGVDRDVTTPAPPDPEDVATGPEAERALRQLLDP